MTTPRSFSNTPASKFVVPDEFRIAPSSTVKKEKSPEVILPKIQSSSFYGGLQEPGIKTSDGASNLMSPPVSVPVLKKEIEVTKSKSLSEPRKKVARPIRRETSATKFRNSSGGMKRKRDGLNKGGFGHGIKKPKKKIRVNVKVSEMKARSIEIPGSKVCYIFILD